MSTGKTDRELAGRIVTGVIAGMITAVAAATAVGFWLSYTGLHDFALRAAMRGPEAWAFPASIDLFIAAGEAGVTISALRRQRDPLAWCYLAVGFGASVTGNVLHVYPAILPWAKYATAAVPPMAAMLALAALLRHVYRLAIDAHLAAEGAPAAARGGWWARLRSAFRSAPETEAQAAMDAPPPVGAALEDAPAEVQPATATAAVSAAGVQPQRTRTRKATRSRTRSAPVPLEDAVADARSKFAASLALGVLPSQRQIIAGCGVGQSRAGLIRADLEKTITGQGEHLMPVNGNGVHG